MRMRQTEGKLVESEPKKPYEKPVLVAHGTVAELTQTGGDRRRDGIVTRAPS